MNQQIAFLNQRARAISQLREWGRTAVEGGMDASRVHWDLVCAMRAVVDEFRVEHDVPGIRYWEHPEDGMFFTTAPGERLSPSANGECVELTRDEFLSRQGLHFGYEERL